ncbi:hypothetical protein IPO96_04500 [Candidatus Saccharibacteria bacterium]|jgi:hypothetical protein|nr:MAG: hypothetical protein IPO96_04500 [Candidatus Saccharibacteria bacterium]
MNDFEIYKDVGEWRCAIEGDLGVVEGLYVNQARLLFDRRARLESKRYNTFGPRTVDLNIQGPERLLVPAEVCLDYIQESIRLRKIR